MERITHHSFNSEGELVRAAAAQVVSLLQRRAERPFTIALSGGRIAEPFYKQLVESSSANPSIWGQVHFFWADERCVASDSTDSNFRQALQSLFKPLQIPDENIHRIHGETEGSYPVDEAEAEICRVCPLDAEGMPILDLVILGMGEDGHTASLFPAEGLEWVADQKVYRAVVATKPPPKRVTLGYQPIIRAKEVVVLVTGAGKKEILERVFARDQSLPLARVVQHRPSITFLSCLG